MKKIIFFIIIFLSLPARAIDYNDFPPNIQQLLDEMTDELASTGGICVAGRITMSDESHIQNGRDVKINFLQGVDIPLWVYDGGWFVMDRTYQAGFNKRPAKLSLRTFGYDPIDSTLATLEGKITYAEFEMKKTPAEDLATVTGIVMGDQNEPVAGAHVNLSFSFASHGVNEEPYRSVTTEPNGRYSFDGLSGTEHHLSAGAPGYAYRSIQFKPTAGEIVTKNLELYPNLEIVIDYVYQADGSRNFDRGNLQTGTIEWVNSSSGGVDFSDGRVEGYEPESLRDIEMRQAQDVLKFDVFYCNGQNGYYDAGAVDFESVKEAQDSGYSTGTKACIVGHTYIVKTYEGNYAKFVVRDIFEEE
jgi:hypothetical protein